MPHGHSTPAPTLQVRMTKGRRAEFPLRGKLPEDLQRFDLDSTGERCIGKSTLTVGKKPMDVSIHSRFVRLNRATSIIL